MPYKNSTTLFCNNFKQGTLFVLNSFKHLSVTLFVLYFLLIERQFTFIQHKKKSKCEEFKYKFIYLINFQKVFVFSRYICCEHITTPTKLLQLDTENWVVEAERWLSVLTWKVYLQTSQRVRSMQVCTRYGTSTPDTKAGHL